MPIRFARGITLIELMVVVAIVAIIAAIAYPSFQNGLQHSRRADAFKTLLTMQLKQEEYRITSSAYSTNLADLGNPSSNYYSFLITHDPQPASRADMASEGLPRLHAPIQPTCS